MELLEYAILNTMSENVQQKSEPQPAAISRRAPDLREAVDPGMRHGGDASRRVKDG